MGHVSVMECESYLGVSEQLNMIVFWTFGLHVGQTARPTQPIILSFRGQCQQNSLCPTCPRHLQSFKESKEQKLLMSSVCRCHFFICTMTEGSTQFGRRVIYCYIPAGRVPAFTLAHSSSYKSRRSCVVSPPSPSHGCFPIVSE